MRRLQPRFRLVIAVAIGSVLTLVVQLVAVRWPGAGDAPSARIVLHRDRGPFALQSQLFRVSAIPAIVANLNREFVLPVDLKLDFLSAARSSAEGVQGPTYRRADRTVRIPWPFLARADEELREHLDPKVHPPSHALIHAAEFIVYHELAHGLIDVLDLPVVGSAEPVADSLAVVLAIGATTAASSVVDAGGVLLAALDNRAATPSLVDFADEHGFGEQRRFDVNCLLYGSNPERFASLVPDVLPARRAASCPRSFLREARAWTRLLGDALRPDSRLARLVR